MSRETYEALARIAAAAGPGMANPNPCGGIGDDLLRYTQADLDAAVAAERERCAKVCEALGDAKEGFHAAPFYRAANAIRNPTNGKPFG